MPRVFLKTRGIFSDIILNGSRDMRAVKASRAEPSIHTSRISAVTASDRVVYADSSKNEDTWCKLLGHYDAEYDSIQEIDASLHTGWCYGRHFAHSDRDDNPNVFYLNRNGAKLKLNANDARSSNRWNADGRLVFRSRKSFHFTPADTIGWSVLLMV